MIEGNPMSTDKNNSIEITKGRIVIKTDCSQDPILKEHGIYTINLVYNESTKNYDLHAYSKVDLVVSEFPSTDPIIQNILYAALMVPALAAQLVINARSNTSDTSSTIH